MPEPPPNSVRPETRAAWPGWLARRHPTAAGGRVRLQLGGQGRRRLHPLDRSFGNGRGPLNPSADRLGVGGGAFLSAGLTGRADRPGLAPAVARPGGPRFIP
jgi:hypothetical protein